MIATYQVTGKDAEELEAAAWRTARRLFGVERSFQITDIRISPNLQSAEGVVLWEADITVFS